MPTERSKVLSWHTGRMTDPELAEYTGLAPRAVGMVMNIGWFADEVVGRGMGGKRTRRVGRTARAAMAATAAMNRAGLTFELAVNILGAVPSLAASVGEVVDYSPPGSAMCSLFEVDRGGGWIPTDIVPAHLWTRFVYRCRDVRNENPAEGDTHFIPVEEWKPGPQGTMLCDRKAYRLPSVEVARIDDIAVYQGEVDPAGFYADDWDDAVALPAYDDHVLIVNGRWVFHKQPDPSPLDTLFAFYTEGPVFRDPEQQRFDMAPIAVIDEGGRTARAIAHDDGERAAAEFALRNAESLLDVNLTLAARRAKRRAYGLRVMGAA